MFLCYEFPHVLTKQQKEMLAREKHANGYYFSGANDEQEMCHSGDLYHIKHTSFIVQLAKVSKVKEDAITLEMKIAIIGLPRAKSIVMFAGNTSDNSVRDYAKRMRRSVVSCKTEKALADMLLESREQAYNANSKNTISAIESTLEAIDKEYSRIRAENIVDGREPALIHIQMQPYGIMENDGETIVRSVVYVGGGCNIYYVAKDNRLGKVHANPYEIEACFGGEGFIAETNDKMVEVLRTLGSYTLTSKCGNPTYGMVENVLASHLGKTITDIENELARHKERAISQSESQRKQRAREKSFVEAYPSLFSKDGAGLLFLPRLNFTISDFDFSVEVPMRAYDTKMERLKIADNSAFLREHKKEFFQYLRERLTTEHRLIDRIGDMRMYQMTDCIVRRDCIVELMFSPKHGIEKAILSEAAAG